MQTQQTSSLHGDRRGGGGALFIGCLFECKGKKKETTNRGETLKPNVAPWCQEGVLTPFTLILFPFFFFFFSIFDQHEERLFS